MNAQLSPSGLGSADGLRPAEPAQTLPLHDALALTAGGACATIRLGDQLYTLRITRQGKLILMK